MKRILINREMIELSKKYARNLFSNRQSDFNLPLDNLNSLKQKLSRFPDYADYVDTIIRKYSILNALKPQYFDDFHTKYFAVHNVNLKKILDFKVPNVKSGKNQTNGKKFHELLVTAMQYKAAREELFPFIRELGIKTCVYCNSQLAATTVKKTKNTYKGMYDLDHFYPKSDYPYLCTSFFNLQPSCAYCNKSKSRVRAEFSLYTNDYTKLFPFKFSLKKNSLVKYMLTQNYEELEIDFGSNDDDLRKDHEKHFHITELYETQKDLAEEIVWKAKIYNKSYQKSLRESFEKLFPKHIDFNRFILGNYYKEEDVHKRPMSKFAQDIAKQLKLI
jgi:hypothetical protein